MSFSLIIWVELSMEFILITAEYQPMNSLHSQPNNFNDSYQNSNSLNNLDPEHKQGSFSQSELGASIKQNNSIANSSKDEENSREHILGKSFNEKSKDRSFEVLLSEEINKVQSDLPRRGISPNLEKPMSAFVKKQNQQSNVHEVGVQNDKTNGSFTRTYKQKFPEMIDQISTLEDREQLEKYIQLLVKRKEELEKKGNVVVHHVATSYVSADKYDKIHQKYEKYKGLYAQQLQTSKKLRGELRNIYNKVSKIDQS